MTPTLTLCVFSDMHFMAWKETDDPVEWVPQLEQSIQDAVSQNPDAVIFNGDLTNGKERDYRLAMRHIRKTIPQPTYFTMGNHEYYGVYEDEDFSFAGAQDRFRHFTDQSHVYYEVRRPDCTLIFLSPERYLPAEFGEAAWLSEEQLNWFENRILLAAPALPVLVFLHQPINDTVTNSTNYCIQSEEIRAILRKRPGCLFLTGHTHCRMDQPTQLVAQDETIFIGGGAACNDTPQSRWLVLQPESIRVRIRDHAAKDWTPNSDFTLKVKNGRAYVD